MNRLERSMRSPPHFHATVIERVWLDHGFTAIMVTHDAAEAVTLADRVLMIEDGQIAEDCRAIVALPRSRRLKG
jgi:sulfonate transport system ATP-binding protein